MATSKGIILAPDDPFELLVHPDGSWQVLTLDIGQTQTQDKTDILSPSLSNSRAIIYFMEDLEEIRHKMDAYAPYLQPK